MANFLLIKTKTKKRKIQNFLPPNNTQSGLTKEPHFGTVQTGAFLHVAISKYGELTGTSTG
jgi:hypothetical protein